MRIVMIRHGQTKINVINQEKTVIYTGALNNELADLSELGKKQAIELSKNSIVKSIEKVYSSDLNRAIETAKLAKPGYQININKNLRERSLGIFEGKQKEYLLESDEYRKYILDNKYNKFRTDFVQKAPEGENYTEVSTRCRNFLNSLDLDEDTTIGVFSHLNVIRCLFLNMFNINSKEKVFDLKIEHCTPYVVEGNEIGKFKLISPEEYAEQYKLI